MKNVAKSPSDLMPKFKKSDFVSYNGLMFQITNVKIFGASVFYCLGGHIGTVAEPLLKEIKNKKVIK